MFEISEYRLSFHLRAERKERVDFIQEVFGFGSVIKTRERSVDNIEMFTDTGIIIVVNPWEKKIITLYVANHRKTQAFFEGRASSEIWETVTSNQSMLRCLGITENY